MTPDHRIIPESGLRKMLAQAMDRSILMGPKARKGAQDAHVFPQLSSAEELTPHYTTTTLPPKKAFFPPEETIFRFKAAAGNSAAPEIDADDDALRGDPMVVAGVHPCDLAAIAALDRMFREPPEDLRWTANRRRAVIVGMDCMPDEYCFCASLGTEAAREPADLFLTAVPDGWLVEVLTPEGEALLAGTDSRPARTEDRDAAEAWRARKRDRMTARLNADPATLADRLDRGVGRKFWSDLARRCFACGSCNTVCPTCYCFSMEDEMDAGLSGGRRARRWDSCQHHDFARIAGGYNFREDRWERLRHRWRHKFLYLYRRYGEPYCTGCGRCSRACVADINIVDATNRLLSAESGEP